MFINFAMFNSKLFDTQFKSQQMVKELKTSLHGLL